MIEILASRIRDNNKHHGICSGSKKFKVTLYVDNIVCSVEDPVESMRELEDVLESFGELVGVFIELIKKKQY